ncbi:phenylacetate--CoA ligase family protein [Halosimplex halobium]|uniref:phenylacetate--CoA ligase family protein n=1 Tax=Halosimplex halobium TaxID=3396618 RepID=UPI003F573A2C
MIYNKIYDLFRRSPTRLRKLLTIIPVKYRLGGSDFSQTYQMLNESEQWDRERLRQYQERRLEEFLEHAVTNVPFYSDVDLPHDDQFRNLREFPVIDKQTIQSQKSEFYAENVPTSKTYEVTTGGTSGNPLQFRLDNSTYGVEWAFIMTGWNRIGYTPGDQLVSFRGVEFTDADDGVYWQYNPFYNTYEMSPFHLNRDTVDEYVAKIKSIDPDFIHGYPSAISTLASYVETENIVFPEIDGVLAASEHLYERQRSLIEDAFGARVFSHYGLSEKVVLAAECEHSTDYHVYPQYGVTEVVDEEGNPVSNGERGEIVGTSLLNRCMPFIRYRTGDYGRLVQSTCECGREFPVIKDLQGKDEKEQSVIKSNGTLFPIHALYHTMHGDTLENVHRVQFVQDSPGALRIRVVPADRYDNTDEKRIRSAVRSKCGEMVEISIEPVDEISLTDRGKQELFVQNLDPEQYR